LNRQVFYVFFRLFCGFIFYFLVKKLFFHKIDLDIKTKFNLLNKNPANFATHESSTKPRTTAISPILQFEFPDKLLASEQKNAPINRGAIFQVK